ncbi:hypothetical protein WAZ07_18315 [Bacillus sp. FJAT-51639]|uniref:Uncharacterized protein n=1 Tax=Bacillus bruguierae TaxID=3127667 RepID=A0ABU8FNH4_9BACI
MKIGFIIAADYVLQMKQKYNKKHALNKDAFSIILTPCPGLIY